MEKEIFVTKAYLPPRAEFEKYLDRIWDSAWLTNMGKLHEQLKEELAGYLGVAGIELFVNGHLALEMCLQAFDFPKGSEVITTPFSFASTTHAIVRQGLRPVFADVRRADCTLDPEKIEELITDRTAAILPVHVYGNVCDVEAIQKIADKYGLKVIYDAAHAFGETVDGRGIGTFGDASMFSFHATKVFNTIEGGAVTWNISPAAAVNAAGGTAGSGAVPDEGTDGVALYTVEDGAVPCAGAAGAVTGISAGPSPAPKAAGKDAVMTHAAALTSDGSGVRIDISGKSGFAQKLYQLKNFGIIGQEQVGLVGGNAKMNEFQAAMGLCNLGHIDELIEARHRIYDRYMTGLAGSGVRCLLTDTGCGTGSNAGCVQVSSQDSAADRTAESTSDGSTRHSIRRNYAYFPVLLETGKRRDEVFEKLAAKGIHARKYFYPCINDYDCYKDEYDSGATPVARDLAARVLTIPIYHDLETETVDEICRVLTE